MGPINYGAMLPQIDLGQEILQWLQLGGALRQQRTQREQQAAAQERARQYSADVGAALSTPTHQAFAALTAKYPEQREAFKQSWDQLSEGQRNTEFGLASKAFAALNSGNTDIATKLYERQIAAKEASGADASEEKMVLDAIKRDPVKAKGFIGYGMFNADPDKYAESVAKLGDELRAQEQAPAALQEAQGKAAKAVAEAKTAEVAAKYADSQAVADLTKKGWDITKIEQDIGIAKETNRIKAMEAAATREGNALKRDELKLKIEEAKRARDEKIRENVATAESAASTADNMLNTIERIKKNPALNDVLGSIEGRLPSVFSDEGSNAIELIDTLGSQAFLAQVGQMKGMGALSNAEGEKLQSALQNLSRKQGEKQFRESLDEAARLIKNGREGISKRTGVPLGAPDTPAAPGARKPLSAFDGGAVTLDPRSGVPTLPGP